jgi:NAD(P)-dependent dehydrogenase (short-subunit alcohol dehydrogenase family)
MSQGDGHVFITGCSTGIGRASVVHLAALGFHVLAAVRTAEHARAVEQAGGANVKAVMLDVTEAAAVAAAAKTVREACGEDGLMGLVNNAGIVVHGPVEFVPLSEWRRQFEVNLFGQIALTQAMLPLLRKGVTARGHGSGRIVMISSIAGLIAQPILSPYNASKYALEAVSDSLRMELRGQGIRVCLIEPGAIDTPIWNKAEANPDVFPPNHPARELYGRAIDGITNASRKSARNALPAEKVARVVAACLTRKRPRSRYPVCLESHVGSAAKALLPTAVMDAGICWALGV